MTSAADRRARGQRNRLVDLLGLGRPAPLVNLPVLATSGSLDPGATPTLPTEEPVLVPLGGTATVSIEDAEPGVTYRVADEGDPAKSRAEGIGAGERLDLSVPRIVRATTLIVEAITPGGRSALLATRREVKVGLDRTLPVTAADAGPGPVITDYRGRVTIKLPRQQEGVVYTLVRRPIDPRGADEKTLDVEEVGLAPTGSEERPDGITLVFESDPLAEDCTLRIRADRAPGKGRRQAALLTQGIDVYVRADQRRAVTLDPPVSEHRGTPAVTIADAQRDVRYDLVIGTLADAQLSRAMPPAPASVPVQADGAVVHAAVPALGTTWRTIPGFALSGAGGTGTGGALTIATPPIEKDSSIVVRATKRHGPDDAPITTEVPLSTPLVALVRPDPAWPLRLVATIADGMLTGLAIEDGQPGVFYRIVAGKTALGELYVHQRDPVDSTRNKGVNRIAVGVDLAIAADLASKAPPPIPRLGCRVPLPAPLTIDARRASTSLRRAMRAAIRIEVPAIGVDGRRGLAERGLDVTVADASTGARYQLLVDGLAVADRVAGTDGPLVLASGAVGRAATVELVVVGPAVDGVAVRRRITVAGG